MLDKLSGICYNVFEVKDTPERAQGDEQMLTGKWATIKTNTGLPLCGKVETIKKYCKAASYTIEWVFYDGPDYYAAADAFREYTSGTQFVIAA